ncbi:DUF4272 domain-containing protein [Variovorax sp. PCZ-1]|uniref:DUF4272 domain-containing protein n=1 Tax=Variovorax sp. PCZ-1 TaxID=2835533 RepID=UPI001BCEC82F|nr:DUF4272 domain-containing protein [Variovorax sp. PCZ-1]MBS7807069.1 DUF4272 domain-containing protein [Variovorax sp. PCZ-1]
MNPSDIRAETIRRFANWQIKANENLPLIESLTDLQPKSSAQVAARATAAGYLAAFCFGAPAEKVHKDIMCFQLWEHLSAEEQSLLSNPDADGQSKASHGWLVEAIQFMAWSLGLVTLDNFAQCSDDLSSHFSKAGTDPSQFIASARLRPLSELLQEADTLYMLHWYAVEASLQGTPDKRILLPRISFRRHAADWIVGVADQWDDISLDT